MIDFGIEVVIFYDEGIVFEFELIIFCVGFCYLGEYVLVLLS